MFIKRRFKGVMYYEKNKLATCAASFFLILSLASTSTFAASVPPSTRRASAVSYMNTMATISWKTPTNSSLYIYNKTYAKNTTFTGMPYTQDDDDTLATFKAKLNSSSILSNARSGNDCSTAVIFSWNSVGISVPNTNCSNIVSYASNSSNSLRIVGRSDGGGSLIVSSNASPQSIISANTKSNLVAAYQLLQKGDALVHDSSSAFSDNWHAILVTGVSTGGVYYTGQGGGIGKTTWVLNQWISYDDLYAWGFVPVTVLY